jgi:hypothetical protein
MILNQSINTNSFIYCSVYQSSHETTNYYNTGNGHFHESIYILEGEITYTFADAQELSGSETFNTLSKGQTLDLTASKGKYVITKTADVGASMIMFNPIPDSKHLSVDFVTGDKTITATDDRVTVICITGPVTIKDKTLNSGQYAVVFANTSADLVQSNNTICALVTG